MTNHLLPDERGLLERIKSDVTIFVGSDVRLLVMRISTVRARLAEVEAQRDMVASDWLAEQKQYTADLTAAQERIKVLDTVLRELDTVLERAAIGLDSFHARYSADRVRGARSAIAVLLTQEPKP